MTARPDIAAITFCLGAMLIMSRQAKRPSIADRPAFLVGLLLGLSLLTHPIGVAGLGQQVLWTLWQGRRRLEWWRPLLLMGCGCAAGISPILLLVLPYREEFLIQFGNNIFKPGSQHLSTSMLNPFSALLFHINHYLVHITAWQGGLLAICAVLAALFRPSDGLRHYRYSLISTPLFVSLALGHHPVWGYYVYYVAVFCAGTGRLVDLLISRRLPQALPRGHSALPVKPIAAAVVIFAALLPGAGFRTTFAHFNNWHDANYDAAAFAEKVLNDIPMNAELAVHEELIIHVWLRRPTAVLGIVIPRCFDVTKHSTPIEYALLRPDDEKETAQQIGNLELVRTYGDLADIFSIKTALYRKR
jgi:hypothetical protein